MHGGGLRCGEPDCKRSAAHLGPDGSVFCVSHFARLAAKGATGNSSGGGGGGGDGGGGGATPGKASSGKKRSAEFASPPKVYDPTAPVTAAVMQGAL